MFRRGLLLLVTVSAALIAVLFSSRSPKHGHAPNPSNWPGRNNTVLFLSNSEHGLGNVLLATSHAMLVEHSDIETHYASFKKFSGQVSTISRFALEQIPDSRNAQPITFHTFKGFTYADALLSTGMNIEDIMHRPGIAGMAKLCKNMQTLLMPWSGPEYLGLYEEVSAVLNEVDPAVVVVEPMFGPGVDAVRAQGRNHVILSPNTLKDNFAAIQPHGAFLWKYPAVGSGYPYPVPWYLIPANIYLNIRFIYNILVAPDLAKKKAYLKHHGIEKPFDVFNIYQKDCLWLSQSLPEADFPISVIPSNVISCGPIYLSTAPAAEQDPELASWVERAPTVLINLGSTGNYDEIGATEMARAIKRLLASSEVQVLWKFNKRRDYGDEFLRELADEIEDGRLRLEKWLKIDPATLMETGNIAVSVNHGGANCYHEAVGTGVPQIILPFWVDLYDFAIRVEWLGIGVWGNRKSSPNWTAEELSSAFLEVLGDGEAAKSIRQKAKDLGRISQRNVGRVIAAGEIAKLARSGRD